MILWFTGEAGAGKTTIANKVKELCEERNIPIEHIDGDSIRYLFNDQDFSRQGVKTNVRRVAYAASLLEKHGVFVIVSLVSPFQADRRFAEVISKDYHEIQLKTDYTTRKERRGDLYTKAEEGVFKNVAGVDVEYEASQKPALILDGELDADFNFKQVKDYLEFRGKL